MDTTLADRLARLERSNRRLAAGLVVAHFAVPIPGPSLTMRDADKRVLFRAPAQPR